MLKDGHTNCETDGYDETVSCFPSLWKRTEKNTNFEALHYVFYFKVTCRYQFRCSCESAVKIVAYNRIYHRHLPNRASHRTLRLHYFGFPVKETCLVQPEVIDFTNLKIPGNRICYKVANYVND